MESEEEPSEGLDTSYIVLIVVFSVAFATPVIVWCVQEVRSIDWEKLFASEQGQRILEAKQTAKDAIETSRKKRKKEKDKGQRKIDPKHERRKSRRR